MEKLVWISKIMACIALVFAAGLGEMYGQATMKSVANGAWTAATTWQIVTGADADTIPDANDAVIIGAGTAVTAGAGNRDCASLTVEAGGALNINGAGNVRINANPSTVSVYGTVNVSSSGNLAEAGAGTRSLVVGSGGKITVSGSAAFPAFDTYNLDPASTVEFTAAGNQTIRSGIVFGNLTIGGSGVKTVAPRPADTVFTARGTVTVGGTGAKLDVSTNILRVNFQGDVFVQAGDTLDASVGVVIVNFSGSQFVNNGVFLNSTTPLFGYTPSTTYDGTTVSGSSPQTYYDLIVNGTMSPGAALTVTRNVMIMPGGALNGGTGLTHTVGGSWSNSGTFNAGTSTMSFTGKGDTLSVSIGAGAFYNVDVADSLSVNLTGNVSVASGGSFSITRGKLLTGPYTLTINNTNPAALSLDTCKVTGTVSRAIALSSTSNYRFFGANAYITPNGTNNPSFITASVYPNSLPPGLAAGADTNKIVRRYMTVAATGPGSGFAYGVRFAYAGSEVRGSQSVYTVWLNSGTGWLNLGASGQPDTIDHFVEQSGLTSFGNVAVAENSAALPIQLVSFTGSVAANSSDVTLTWRTVSETVNYGFFIQRSMSPTDGFIDPANNFVPGHGTTLVPHAYSWVDAQMPPGTYYYRLKQMDLDGSFTYTEPLKVVVEGNTTGVESRQQPVRFALEQNYPNPFNPSTRIKFSVDNAMYTTVSVYNVQGVEVASLFSGMAAPGVQYEVTFEGKSLANGVYFCRLTSGSRSAMTKMILLK